MQGESLKISMKDEKVVIEASHGGKAHVTIKDVMQLNGVIHVIDHVLMPYLTTAGSF